MSKDTGATAKSLLLCKAVLWKVGGWILEAGVRNSPVSGIQSPALQFEPLDSESNRGARHIAASLEDWGLVTGS